MSKYASIQFWTDTFDRALASFAQGVIGAAGLDGIGILDVDWTQVLSIAGAYTVLSIATSITFRGNGNSDTPGTPTS